MKLNKVEFIAMNNPLRAIVQKYVEIKKIRDITTLPKGKVVLEIGCGNGNGAKLIQKYFSPKQIYAIDIDQNMIKIAKDKVKDDNISFMMASATNLPFESDTFDAIFDFGVIHHIPNWGECIKELKRVLKPGGELIIEDLSTETFDSLLGKLIKKITDHPYERMFSRQKFIASIEENGFKNIKVQEHFPFKLIKYFTVNAVR